MELRDRNFILIDTETTGFDEKASDFRSWNFSY